MEEELLFAGHPVLGAAVVAHTELFKFQTRVNLEFELPDRTVQATSDRQ